jgi:hypothetical protein
MGRPCNCVAIRQVTPLLQIRIQEQRAFHTYCIVIVIYTVRFHKISTQDNEPWRARIPTVGVSTSGLPELHKLKKPNQMLMQKGKRTSVLKLKCLSVLIDCGGNQHIS